MPRSTYVYIVRTKEGAFFGAWTVKRESQAWCNRNGDLSELVRVRVKDGGGKEEKDCPWEF